MLVVNILGDFKKPMVRVGLGRSLRIMIRQFFKELSFGLT